MALNLKTLLFVSVFIASVTVPIAEAQLELISGLVGLIRIQGIVYCTSNGNISVNGTSTPVFRNALVQLQCGDGTVVSSATTNGSGVFSILLDPLQFVLSSVLTNCSLMINTSLATCNAKLPAVGSLLSPLQFVENTLLGVLNVSNISPAGFHFLQV